MPASFTPNEEPLEEQDCAWLPERFLSHALARFEGRLEARAALFELLRPAAAAAAAQTASKLLTARTILRRLQGRADTTKAWMTNLCEYLDAPIQQGAVVAHVRELHAFMESNRARRLVLPVGDLPSILAEEPCFLNPNPDFRVPHAHWVAGVPGLRPKTRIALMELVLPHGADVAAVEARRRLINRPYPMRETDPADPHPPDYFCIFGANPISLDWLRYCFSLGAEVTDGTRLSGNNLLVETCIDADDLPAQDVVPALRLVLAAAAGAFDLADTGFDDYGINAPAVAHLAKHKGITAEAFELVLGGASPDAAWTFPRNMDRCNLLNYAAEHGGSVPGLLALRLPPQVDLEDGAGFTPLETVAFCHPVLENAVALIDAGADLAKEMVEEDDTLEEFLEDNADDNPVFVAIYAHLNRKRAREGDPAAAAAAGGKSART